MAKTVDNHSTIEDFRRRYNELATDVGEISGLRDTIKNFNGGTLVDAVNAIEDKVFFFKEFIFTATSGQQTFTGNDDSGEELKFKPNRLQVFKNGEHLVSNVDYTIGNPSGGFYLNVQLTSGATLNDVITVYSFTGSFEGTSAAQGSVGYFVETAQNTIYNSNQNGVILNGDNSTPTTALQTGYTIQLAGKTYAEDDIAVASGKKFVGNLTGNVTGQVSTISNHAISALSDVDTTGATNGQLLIYNSSAGEWQADDAPANYTDEQAQDTVASMITGGTHTNITVSYDDNSNTLSFTGSNSVTGGDGLTLTGTDMSVNTSNGVKISGDNVVLDYETTSTAPSSVGSTSTGHLWFVI
jgi:hypothetical protein